MNQVKEFRKISEEIRALGGELSAGILDEIAENFHTLSRSEHFDPQKFLNTIWQQVHPDERNNIDRFRDKVIGRIGGGNINLIPSETPGACRPFCLAVASGTFGEKYYPSSGKIGFKGMMLKLAELWFGCLSVNQENLILTSDWDESAFKDLYNNLINTYCSTHGKKLYVVLVSNSNIRLMHSS